MLCEARARAKKKRVDDKSAHLGATMKGLFDLERLQAEDCPHFVAERLAAQPELLGAACAMHCGQKTTARGPGPCPSSAVQAPLHAPRNFGTLRSARLRY